MKIIQIEDEIYKLDYMANNANLSVLYSLGDMRILATVCIGKEPISEEFMPLSVQYIHKFYSVGKIPGGYVKRESKPSDFEVLTSRIIDRALRPLFPASFRTPVHISILVLSYSGGDLQVCAFNAASLALFLSKLPFIPALGSFRVPLDGVLESKDNVLVCASKEGILMLEMESAGVSEEDLLSAIELAERKIHKRCDLIEESFREILSQKSEKKDSENLELASDFEINFENFAQLQSTDDNRDKLERAKRAFFKSSALDGVRIDGRELDCVRKIEIETNLLPCAHGSALFTRGRTQALCVATIGSSADRESREELLDSKKDGFMFQYNFYPFSVGEAAMIFGTSRREIGHGYLAKKALESSIIDKSTTLRLVSEILESDGSSSMASVCAGSLALRACGIETSDLIAGVAMGLVKSGDRFSVLSDISELEDHYGDMDCKVAGSRDALNAMQMDTKIANITLEDIKNVLEKARSARRVILEKMQDAIAEMKINYDLLPASVSFEVPEHKIADIIGPSGRTIKDIIQRYKVSIDLNKESAYVKVTGKDKLSTQRAKEFILRLVQDFKEGEELEGRVKSIVDFGMFIELAGFGDGLVHSSKITRDFNIGEMVRVRILSLNNGKISLDLA